MSTVYGPKWPFYSCCNDIGMLGTGFMQVMYLGRPPRTKETLPDFLKWRRVTRHPLIFRGLTGSQRTPGFGASHLGIRAKVNDYLRSSVCVVISLVLIQVSQLGIRAKVYKYLELSINKLGIRLPRASGDLGLGHGL